MLTVHSVDISGNAVYYQTAPDGQIQRLDKSNIMVIKYADGQKWMPEMETASPAAGAAERNAFCRSGCRCHGVICRPLRQRGS